jgi:hypothetical protein
MVASHVSYAIKLSVACAEVSHVADENDENTVGYSGLDGCVCHKWETAPCLEQQNLCSGRYSLFYKATVLFVGDFIPVTCKGLSLILSLNTFIRNIKNCNCNS